MTKKFGSPLDSLSTAELVQVLRARESATIPPSTAENLEIGASLESAAIYEEIIRRQKSIYGDDDRREVSSVFDSEIQQNALGVAAIVRSADISGSGDAFRLLSGSFKYSYRLCEGEPFAEQPIAALATAFLTEPDIVLTAGHAIDPNAVDAFSIVFGFRMVGNNAALTFSRSEVFSIQEIVGRRFSPKTGEDWAKLRLDREAVGRVPLVCRSDGKIEGDARVYVIGHPCGLPMKVTGSTSVLENSAFNYFTAPLDTFAGNSGSPVINSDTHEVEGILIDGAEDFVPVGACFRALVIKANETGLGERCMRIGIASKTT